MPSKSEWTNVSTTPQSLASGRPLAPGESAACDLTDPHDVALRDAGHLVKSEKEAKS
jgi:hypothetical protein